ncbi:hypothetical protein LEN26_002986, partial [Aphanomyces euteiches]
NCGRKRIRSDEEIEQAIRRVPQQDRQTMRTLEHLLGIPKTIIIRHMQEKKALKARTSRVKPLLTQDNKKERLRFAASHVNRGPQGTHFFSNMHNVVHVDEKWFFVTRVKKCLYVYDDEAVAARL